MIIDKKTSNFVLLFTFFLFFIVTPFSVLVGSRGFELGTDTENYYNLYYWFVESGYMALEPGIYIFAAFSDFLSGDVELFFASIFVFYYFCISLIYYNLFNSWLRLQEFLVFYIFLLGAFFLSSWFQVATINVLRHGLALVLLYLSISYLVNEKYLASFFIVLISISFHYSIVVFLPLVFLFFIKEKIFLFLYFVTALFYPLGVNEYLIGIFSSLTRVPIHSLISNYAEGNLLYVGFNLYFYVYTIFWFILSFYIMRFFCCDSKREIFNKIIRVYGVLSIVYFVFGFAAFSNRYAFFSWLFIPFLQAALLISMNLPSNIKVYISFAFLFIGLGNYFLMFNV